MKQKTKAAADRRADLIELQQRIATVTATRASLVEERGKIEVAAEVDGDSAAKARADAITAELAKLGTELDRLASTERTLTGTIADLDQRESAASAATHLKRANVPHAGHRASSASTSADTAHRQPQRHFSCWVVTTPLARTADSAIGAGTVRAGRPSWR